MVNSQYPQLTIDLNKLKENVETMIALCKKNDISITGVVKGYNGIPELTEMFIEGGITSLGSSRLSQLERIKESHPAISTMLLRIPMLTEIKQMLGCTDISLNSEITVIKAINEEAKKLNSKHQVILMADLGDLREGYFSESELLKAATTIVNELPYIELVGVGTNLGCYGSIQPDQNNLGLLVDYAKKIRKTLGIDLPIISGGATTTIPMVLKGEVPQGVNHLRIGDGILLRDMEYYFDYTFPELNGDIFKLHAEVVEIKEKPSHPVGTVTIDAFGNKNTYEDIGTQKRMIVAVGRQDVGDPIKLIPDDKQLSVIGGSSDHTILDATNTDTQYEIGTIVSFGVEYEGLLFSTVSEYIHKKFIR